MRSIDVAKAALVAGFIGIGAPKGEAVQTTDQYAQSALSILCDMTARSPDFASLVRANAERAACERRINELEVIIGAKEFERSQNRLTGEEAEITNLERTVRKARFEELDEEITILEIERQVNIAVYPSMSSIRRMLAQIKLQILLEKADENGLSDHLVVTGVRNFLPELELRLKMLQMREALPKTRPSSATPAEI